MRKLIISFKSKMELTIKILLCCIVPYRFIKYFIRDIKLEASILHPKTFGYFKDRYKGKKIVIVATGPTVKDYIPIKDAVHIGINRAFLLDKVKFDILLCSDYRGIESIAEEFANYEENSCIKFIDISSAREACFPSYYPSSIKHLRSYVKLGYPAIRNLKIYKEIDKYPLWGGSTSAIQAMQIAFWTNPKQIYLVGCDCSVGIKYEKPQYFTETKRDHTVDRKAENKKFANDYGDYEEMLIFAWKRMKLFAKKHYPETEIISINPVGLKGLFKDEYS
ncbi:MAG: hypothetical protein LBH25_02785 [Fibromonadaceae bacterium]|jgi:hypothetical protein|nr:hypothetical protein [Fibromonadaceae bacterium]